MYKNAKCIHAQVMEKSRKNIFDLRGINSCLNYFITTGFPSRFDCFVTIVSCIEFFNLYRNEI